MADRKEFLNTVSGYLGRPAPDSVTPSDATALSMTTEQAAERAAEVRRLIDEQQDALFSQAAGVAEKASWVVHRASNPEDLADVIASIASGAGAKSVMRSSHTVLQESPVDGALRAQGIDVSVMQGPGAGSSEDERDNARRQMRAEVFQTDIGITGADWFIAETGTVVLKPRAGVSRLLSLAPPRHIAVLEKGTVVPSLDELFALERAEQLQGTSTASMNLISGPSRTGDIEATVVTGIHGPYEVHLVLLD